MTKEDKNHQHNTLKGYNMLLYFAGSMIMHEPSEECIMDFWTKGILKNLPVSSSNPNFIKAAAQLRDSCSDPSTCARLMCEDYSRLFGRNPLPLAPAFESLYTNSHLTASNKSFPGVTDFYNSYGWVSKFKGKITDDHLGIELLFLTILIDKYLALDDEACLIELSIEIRKFIDRHILSWVCEWNDKIQDSANTLCYRGIGTLIYACVQDIYGTIASHQVSDINA